MVFIVKKSTTKEEVNAALSKLKKKRKSLDVNKYSGKINFGVDGLEYQKKIRDEWE